MSDNLRTLTVSLEEAGDRIDRFLSLKLCEFSRTRYKDLVKKGQISANGITILEPNYRVKPGDEISVLVPDLEDPVPKPENIPLDVVYEDADLIVINKPAGLVVHPAAGNWNGTLVNALLSYCGDSLSGIGGVRRPGIVHRIDKETSGLMVVAKSDRAHVHLSEQFAAHGRDGRLERAYQAIVWGVPSRRKGVITAPLGRKQSNRQKIAVVKDGRHAVTRFEVLETLPPGAEKPRASLVRCTLETGRTHQIRVHMAHIGHPVLGDATYGSHFAASARLLSEKAQRLLRKLGRQALHAGHLGFEHPVTGKAMWFDSPLPADIENVLNVLRLKDSP